MSIEMRMKYGKGIASQNYIVTGEPSLTRCQDKDQPDYRERNAENTQKAIRNFRQWKARRKGPEYRIIFE